MSFSKLLLSASLLLLLVSCGPPTSSDPAAKDKEFVLYEPDESRIIDRTDDTQARMIALRTRLVELEDGFARIQADATKEYDSVASGTTEKTEQRAGGTERMQNLPDRGANVGTTFDSLTKLNRDLLGGARYLETEAENLELEANTRITEARAALATARAENEWTDEEVKVYEAPILAAETALEDLTNSHKTLREELTNGEDVIMEKRENTPGTPNQN